jgi:hypothetical protein
MLLFTQLILRNFKFHWQKSHFIFQKWQSIRGYLVWRYPLSTN